jgi:tripartite-type tricarboxylate transporter receptor subunit TctC
MFFRIASLALSVCALALPASAADYPDHAIKMIVPFAAGGGTDVLARKTSTANGASRSWSKINRAPQAASAQGPS